MVESLYQKNESTITKVIWFPIINHYIFVKYFTIYHFFCNRQNFTIMRNFLPFLLILTSYYAIGQCGNFTNSITNVTIGACNGDLDPPSAQVCANLHINFKNGNASYYWGYHITEGETTTTETFGYINVTHYNDSTHYLCAAVPCGGSISFFINAYSNPNGGGNLCIEETATILTEPYYPSVLPIVLKSFQVSKMDSYAKLNWLTSSETNNDYFTIERSADGQNFDPLEVIKGAGNSTNEISYEWIDKKLISGSNYYRLKQTDYDGKFTYSNIVRTITDVRAGTKIYPNPTTSAHVNVLSPSENSLQIMDVFGKSYRNQNISEGLNSIDVADLPAGILIFKIGDHVQKIMKK